MGTFAELIKYGDTEIPEEKLEELKKRLEFLFQAGGMMEFRLVQLYGIEATLLQKAEMHDDGMEFHYNYFEDSCWERAGFSTRNNCVFSGKIGWGAFNIVMISAYVLEELYTKGITAVKEDENLISGWGAVGWINYLFDEHYHIKNFDPWKLFEAIHYSEEEWEKEENYDWKHFGRKRFGMIGSCEVYAVLCGTESAIREFETIVDENDFARIAFKKMKKAKGILQTYQKESVLDEKTQIMNLMNILRHYYQNKSEITDEQELILEEFKVIVEMSDAPAFIVKTISEIYNVDFWGLWEEIKYIVVRKQQDLYGNDGYYVLPLSTLELMKLSADDLILFWQEKGDIVFSEELEEWFKNLKMQYDMLIEKEVVIARPIEYIMELMKYAEDNYFRIFAFSDFFEETLENLSDKRYLTLWRLYDNMLHDPEMEEAGSVIFVPDGPEHEKEGIHYWGKQPKRRLKHIWDYTLQDERNNIARVTFRRYMELLANKTLRKKVFGF